MKDFLNETGSLIKNFWYFLINYFFLIWAHSPILSLTSDSNFTNLHFPSSNKNVRISFLSIYFGEYVFHIFTWNFYEKNFRLIKKLSLSGLKTFNTDDESYEFQQKMSDFKNHISSLSNTEKDVEKEFLAKTIETENLRIDKSEGKINFFAAIILAIITIINVNFVKDFFSNYSFTVRSTLILLIFYIFLNLCIIILQNMSVRSYNSSSFSDLKSSPEKEDFYIEQMYYDYYFSKEKAQLFVSYICRIYDYIKTLIFIMVLVLSTGVINRFYIQNLNNTTEVTVITINAGNLLDIYSKDRIAFSEVLLELQKNHYSRILILSQKEVPSEIQQKISLFDRQKIYYLIDNTLSENEIKIIVEE